MNNSEDRPIGEPVHDSEANRLDRVKAKTRETVDRAKDRLAAGAAGATEIGRSAMTGARDRATRAAEFVRESETDVELKGAVTHRTESGLDRAGDAVTRAAPTIGRTTEMAAERLGQALHALSHPTALLLGTIAGVLGGWWRKAADRGVALPEPDHRAYQEHFAAIAAPPPGMTYDQARPGYELGHVASQNPSYQGREFADVDQDLQQAFSGDESANYDSLREFTKYGYEKGREEI